MPDRYIIWRNSYEHQGVDEWRREFRKLNDSSREEFLEELRLINLTKFKRSDMISRSMFASLLEHYYPGGKTPVNRPYESDLSVQGLATGYDVLSPEDLADTEDNQIMAGSSVALSNQY